VCLSIFMKSSLARSLPLSHSLSKIRRRYMRRRSLICSGARDVWYKSRRLKKAIGSHSEVWWGHTTPESKKGPPKVNFPSGQWFPKVKTVP
jgi:hypothetical protein